MSIDQNGARTEYAVLLVDPFPNTAAWPTSLGEDRLTAMIRPLLGMLIDQARFKPQELSLALKASVFSRFAILPQSEHQGKASDDLPIACGALGGFSGFLHHSFRRHDYLLGMRNAQAFLRWHLHLPESNPIFNDWKASAGSALDKWFVRPPPPPDARSATLASDRSRAPISVAPFVDGEARDRALPIIPLTPRLQVPIEIPASEQPRPRDLAIDRLEGLIDQRLRAVVAKLVDDDLAAYIPFGWLGAQIAKWRIPTLMTKRAKEVVAREMERIGRAFT